ncbi:MAG: VWA domain-containing protein [Lyngbya sp. HA4199-MV5]|nr:VWA domain-containing protein [Lyngbya sp. HA4199-MV5]
MNRRTVVLACIVFFLSLVVLNTFAASIQTGHIILKFLLTIIVILCAVGLEILGGIVSRELERTTVILILDASGSMDKEDYSGDKKIEVAKEILLDTVSFEEFKLRTVGLTVVGNSSNKCHVATLVKPGINNRSELRTQIRAVEARGKTALAKAIQQAIDELKPNNFLAESVKYLINVLKPDREAPLVVLVTDGLETCGGKFADTVKAAKKKGIDFRLRWVGYAVNEEHLSQIYRIVEECDGKYFRANNKEELQQVMYEVISEEGGFKIQKPKGIAIKSWKIYLENCDSDEEAILGRRKINESDESLWGKHSLPPGTYDLYVYFENRSSTKKRIKLVVQKNRIQEVRI